MDYARTRSRHKLLDQEREAAGLKRDGREQSFPRIWWTVWKGRNGRCSEDRFSTMQKIEWNRVVNFHFWCKEENAEDVDQLVNFLGSP